VGRKETLSGAGAKKTFCTIGLNTVRCIRTLTGLGGGVCAGWQVLGCTGLDVSLRQGLQRIARKP